MKLILILGVLVELTCVRAAKPGVCPKDPDATLVSCTPRCASDENCVGAQKCCKTYCNDGTQCQIPDEKPGSCPATSEVLCAKSNTCTADTNCDNYQKCCNSICNTMTCWNPV